MSLLQSWKESLLSYLAEDFKPLSVFRHTYALWLRHWWWLVALVAVDFGWGAFHNYEIYQVSNWFNVHETGHYALIMAIPIIIHLVILGLFFFSSVSAAYAVVTNTQEKPFDMKRFAEFVVLLGVGMLAYAFAGSIMWPSGVQFLMAHQYEIRIPVLVMFVLFFFLDAPLRWQTLYQSILQGVGLFIYTYPAVLIGGGIFYLLYAAVRYLHDLRYHESLVIESTPWLLLVVILTTLLVIYPLYVAFWMSFCQKNKNLISE